MSGFWAGAVVGGVLGAGVAVLASWAIRRWREHRGDVDPVLSDADRAELAEGFRRHSEAVQQQVSAYADSLAGSDQMLRDTLRRFEKWSAA